MLNYMLCSLQKFFASRICPQMLRDNIVRTERLSSDEIRMQQDFIVKVKTKYLLVLNMIFLVNLIIMSYNRILCILYISINSSSQILFGSTGISEM